jgi:hypothetical protein
MIPTIKTNGRNHQGRIHAARNKMSKQNTMIAPSNIKTSFLYHLLGLLLLIPEGLLMRVDGFPPRANPTNAALILNTVFAV